MRYVKCLNKFFLFVKKKKKILSVAVFLSGQQAVFLPPSNVTTSVARMCRAVDKGRVAGQRWQVASCHQSWRDGCCDILGLNNLHCNNTSPLATVKCGSWRHVSLMPSPPKPFHNSAGTEGAAMCRHTAHWHQGHGEGERPDAEEVKDGEILWGEAKGSVKVRERLQFNASI